MDRCWIFEKLCTNQSRYQYQKICRIPTWWSGWNSGFFRRTNYRKPTAILTIYQAIKDETAKQLIAKEYGYKKHAIFYNNMNTIKYIRNTCAHSGVIFDLKTPKGIKPPPNTIFNKNNRHSLDSSIKTILCILSVISENRKKEMENKIDELFKKHAINPVVKTIIEQKIGYIIAH
mgnify:CR=1 FL=1